MALDAELMPYRRIPQCHECGRCTSDMGGRQPLGTREEVERLTREVIRRIKVRMGEELPPTIPVGISVRHVHLTPETLEQLYGPEHTTLEKMRDLVQPGSYAAQETVTVVGPRMRVIERVRVLGPLRDYNQVELSRTDGFYLGLELPVRNSGDLEGAPSVTLVGPVGSVMLEEGAIRATRHIHISPEDAERFGVQGVEMVRVVVPGPKGLIFNNVYIKAAENLVPEIHLDTDDANAADLSCGDLLAIEK